MEISEKQLRSMAADVDEQHREAMKTFAEQQRDLLVEVARDNRRRFLRNAGMGTAAIGLAGALGPKSVLAVAAAQELTDQDIAAYAASVEYAAVEVYKAAAPLLSPATLPVAQMFLQHHQEHGDAFKGAAAKGEIAPNKTLVTMFTDGSLAMALIGKKLENEADVLKFANKVENAAAATYVFAMGALKEGPFYSATATILPVESAHAVVLGMAAGLAPTDENVMPQGGFESDAGALKPADYPMV